MVEISLDGVSFPLGEERDFTWLRAMGRVFRVFAQNDSGNIGFGVDDGKRRFFVKAAGLPTAGAARSPEEAVASLRAARRVYETIRHPNLIRSVRWDSAGELFFGVFEWAEGECLFDHWNFEKYRQNPQIVPPAERFRLLPPVKRVRAAEVLFSFLSAAAHSGYAAVDFYDGSILYDFAADAVTLCDIDLFRQKPAFNDMGRDFYGTKRLKAPEEYEFGAAIDEATNVFTLGALLFGFFGTFTDAEIRRRYEESAFTPCPWARWELNRASYEVARRAVRPEREERFATIGEFHRAWVRALPAELAAAAGGSASLL